MKPRLGQSSRVREPRIDPQPLRNERDHERLIQPVDLPDGDDDSGEEEHEGDQPAEPRPEEPMEPRASGRPAAPSQSPAPRRYQVLQTGY